MPYVRTRLGRLFFEERGDREKSGDRAIVLCHGLMFDSRMWNAQVEPMARIGRTIVIDGPGHGKSEVPPRFSIEDHADAMRDAMDELGIARAVMVGLSWGGMVSMRIALQHPTRVQALALLDTSAQPEKWQRRIRYRAFIKLAARWGVPRPLVDQIVPVIYAPESLAAHPELHDEFARNVNGYDRLGVARASNAVLVHRTDITDKLPKIQAPTLVICGRKDRATSPRKSETIARGISGSRIEWIEGSGHMSAIEKPAEVNAVLEPFVRNHMI